MPLLYISHLIMSNSEFNWPLHISGSHPGCHQKWLWLVRPVLRLWAEAVWKPKQGWEADWHEMMAWEGGRSSTRCGRRLRLRYCTKIDEENPPPTEKERWRERWRESLEPQQSVQEKTLSVLLISFTPSHFQAFALWPSVFSACWI